MALNGQSVVRTHPRLHRKSAFSGNMEQYVLRVGSADDEV